MVFDRAIFAAALLALAACGGKGDTRELPLRAGVAGATLSLRCNKDLGASGDDAECRDTNPGTYAPGATKPPPKSAVPVGTPHTPVAK